MLTNELLNYAKSLGFGELYFKIDQATQLYAIIALHSTRLGPALGGCRFKEYPSIDLAIHDALRLAQGMSYKAALANLPLGGGKTVVIRPTLLEDRNTFFQTLGRFVNDLHGRYIIAMDSGVATTDMDSIASETRYVVTTSKQGNPAPYTALGVLHGIKAAVKFKFDNDNLEDLHIAIQGLGQVGYNLAMQLHKERARLTVSDPNKELAEAIAKKCNATIINPEAIYSVDCDIFSPCALGAILNDNSIPQIKAKIIAGGANNQLAEPRHAALLQAKEILYAPDYVINAGGLIYAYAEYCNLTKKFVEHKVQAIYETLLKLFKLAKNKNRSPHEVANIIAEAQLTSTTESKDNYAVI